MTGVIKFYLNSLDLIYRFFSFVFCKLVRSCFWMSLMENVHLRRTYGRASSVMRFAGAPMETTAAAFAMKTSLC